LKHQYKVRIFMDESVSFGTLGATGHGVTEHLNVPVCGMSYCADTNCCFVAMEATGVSRVVLLHDRCHS